MTEEQKTAEQLVVQAIALCKQRKYAEAIALYNEAIRLKPDYALTYYNRGIAKSNLGRNEEAINDCDEAIRLDPKDATAYYNRGNAKSDLGRHEEAIKDYDEAIRLDPKFALAYNNRGATESKLGRFEEAIKDCDEAIRLKPDYAFAYNNRGNAKSKLGRHEDAITDFDRSVEYDPKNFRAYFGRGETRWNLDRKPEAIEDFRLFLALADDSVPSLKKAAEGYIASIHIKNAPPSLPVTSEQKAEQLSTGKEYEEAENEVVMFFDIVKSTDIIGKYDDEDTYMKVINALIKMYQEIGQTVSPKYDKKIGDGRMAVYDNPKKAINAAKALALKVVEHNKSTDEKCHFYIRIGLDCGKTKVSMTDKDRYGKTVIMASRLQSLKAGDFVPAIDPKLMPENNRILMSGRMIDAATASGFEFIKLGAAEIKGFSHQLFYVYRVM